MNVCLISDLGRGWGVLWDRVYFFFSRSFDKRLCRGRGTHTYTNYTKAFIILSIVFCTMTHKRRRYYMSYNVLYDKYLQNVMYDASRKKNLPACSHRVRETANLRRSFSRLSINTRLPKKRTQKRYFGIFPDAVCDRVRGNVRESPAALTTRGRV